MIIKLIAHAQPHALQGRFRRLQAARGANRASERGWTSADTAARWPAAFLTRVASCLALPYLLTNRVTRFDPFRSVTRDSVRS